MKRYIPPATQALPASTMQVMQTSIVNEKPDPDEGQFVQEIQFDEEAYPTPISLWE